MVRISAALLRTMRETQAAALPETCTRIRAALTPDGQGGYVRGAATSITLPCRVSSRGLPDEYLQESVAVGKDYRMVTLAHGADVQRSDTLVIAGVTHQVIGFASAGQWATALRAVCEVVT